MPWSTRIRLSGLINVPARSQVEWLSVAGEGFIHGVTAHKVLGIPADRGYFQANIDGTGWSHDYIFPSIAGLDGVGIKSVGTFLSGIVITLWDRTGRRFWYHRIDLPKSYFRSSVAFRYVNNFDEDSRQGGAIMVTLSVASRMVLCELRRYVRATWISDSLRELSNPEPLLPVVVQRLGVFEDGEECPYNEYVARLTYGVIAEIYVPDDVDVRKVVKIVRPYRVLYE